MTRKQTTSRPALSAAWPRGWSALRALVFVVAALCTGSATAFADKPPTADFRVIAHPQTSVSSVSRQFVTDAFLKNTTRWSDGETIRPVDQRPSALVRQRFSEKVLKRSVAAVRSYWQQRIFSGRGIPPPELESDDAVIAYVLKHPGAVGYVSGSADPGEAKVIAVK